MDLLRGTGTGGVAVSLQSKSGASEDAAKPVATILFGKFRINPDPDRLSFRIV